MGLWCVVLSHPVQQNFRELCKWIRTISSEFTFLFLFRSSKINLFQSLNLYLKYNIMYYSVKCCESEYLGSCRLEIKSESDSIRRQNLDRSLSVRAYLMGAFAFNNFFISPAGFHFSLLTDITLKWMFTHDPQ